MKKNLITAFILLSFSVCYAQKSYRLYNVNLNASEILGTKNADFDPLGADNHENGYLNPPLPSESIYATLGSVYNLNNPYNLNPFLNTMEDNADIVDEINDRYISKYGMRLLSSKYGNDKTFSDFKAAYNAPDLKPSEKVALFNDSRYDKFRQDIEDQKYETYVNREINFTEERGTAFKLGLVAKIKAALSKVVGLDASTADSLSNKIVKTVKAQDLKFYEIRLKKEYIKSASSVILKYWQNKDLLAKLKDPSNSDFSQDLYKYLNTANDGIISYVSLFSATFTTTKKTDLESAIGATISASINPSDKTAITATIKAEIDHYVKDDVSNTGGKAYYVIAYGVDNALEIGSGSPDNN